MRGINYDGSKSAKRKKILIGFVSNDNTESISIITKAIIRGLREKYDFIPLYANRKFGSTKRGTLTFINLTYFLKHLFSWVAKIIKYSPDLAHYPITSFWNMEKSLSFLFFAHLFGVKTIGHLHGGKFIEFWQNISSIRKKMALFVFKRMDALIVLSPGWRLQIMKLLNIPRERIFVVNNQIDRDFEEVALKHEYNNNSDSILCLGVMDTQKGVFDILEAAKMLDENISIRFVLAGPERESNIYKRIENYIKEFKLDKKIILKRGVWAGDKIALFKSSAGLLLPSYSENFPVVLIEAAAFGLPIITTPAGATPEYFKDNISALYVKPGNPDQILEAVLSIFQDKKKRISLGNEARNVYLKILSNSESINRLEAVYNAILK